MTEATGPIGAIAVLLALSVAPVGVTASPLPSVRVIAVVPVGTGPQEVAIDPLNGYLYVTNTGSNNVTIINGATNTVVASVAVGRFPRATAVDDRTGNLYVTNTGSGTVSVLNGSSGTLLVTIAPPSLTGPSGIVFDPATASLYFAAYTSAPPFSGELVIVNDTTNTVVGQIPLPDLAHELAYDPRNGLIYAGLTTSVAIIDPATRAVVATTRVGPSPVSIAIDSLNGHVFVTSLNSWNVSVLDDVNNSLIGSIPCGFQSWGVAFDTRTNEMIVTTESTASPFQNGLTMIDPVNDTISTSVLLGVGSTSGGVAVDSNNGELYAAGGAAPQAVTVVAINLPTAAYSGLSQSDSLILGFTLAGIAAASAVWVVARRRRS